MQVEVDGTVVEGFAYTGTGRLAGVIRDGAVDEVFVHDGDDQIASVSATGAINWTATWGTRLNELVRFENDVGDAFVPVLDLRGSIVGGWLDDGSWTVTSHYDEQGRQSSPTGPAWCQADGERCAFVAGFPFGYTGAWVAESGILSLRHRWLSPELGQFLSADPLEYIDSFNRFAYAGFDPINGVDPFGLDSNRTDADKGWDPPEPAPDPDNGDDAKDRVRERARRLLATPENPNPELPGDNPRLTPGKQPGFLDRLSQLGDDVDDALDDVGKKVADVLKDLGNAFIFEFGARSYDSDLNRENVNKGADGAGAATKFVIAAAAVVVTDGIAGAVVEGAVVGEAAVAVRTTLTAGKKFKQHFLDHHAKVEKALGIKVGKYSEGGGEALLKAIGEAIDNGTFKFVGQATLRKGHDAVNVYRGNGVTIITKPGGEWVTAVTSGEGMDLGLMMVP